MSHSLLHSATASICGLACTRRQLIQPTHSLSAPSIALGISCTRSVGTRAPHSRQLWSNFAVIVPRAGGADVEPLLDDDHDDLEDIGLGPSSGEPFDESQLGPLPSVRYQPSMQYKERKVWRSKANALAKEKKLLNIQIGQLGITPSFLRACADILQKHSLVRVKLGDGCGLERNTAAQVLEKYLDCVCVFQLGFTVTLYRQAGLPRPSNTLADGNNADADVAPGTTGTPSSSSAASVAVAAAASKRVARQEKEARKMAGQQTPQQRPPEFSVL